MIQRLLRTGLGTIFSIIVIIISVWLLYLGAQLDHSTQEFASKLVVLERRIGYGGFIHHFKNYVLRPGEQTYYDLAVRDYQAATAVLDQLGALEEGWPSRELSIDVRNLRETLDSYRAMLDRVSEARQSGASVQEIDRIVRISDDLANIDIDALRQSFEKILAERRQVSETGRIWTFLLTALLFSGWALLVYLFKRRDAERTKQTLREVSQARDQLDAVFGAVSSAIIGLDSERNVVTLNPQARELLDLPQGAPPFPWPETIQFLDLEHMQPLEGTDEPVTRALEGPDIRGEVTLLSLGVPATEPRYVRVSSARIAHAAPQLATVIAVEDVTDAERSRQRIERQGRLEALGQLTGGVAHDFNNVLATILYANDLALRTIEDERPKRLIEQAIKSVKRGTALTARLLTFAKRQPGRASVCHVNDFFDDMQVLMLPVVKEGVDLRFETADSGLSVFCDSGQLESALMNLILNSRHALYSKADGGRILVKARAVQLASTGDGTGLLKDYVEISVSDDGPGMSPAVLARATDPFFTTKTEEGGSGLGLSMVYGFVQQEGGELKIYSEETYGTTVCLNLPRAAENVSAPREQAAQPAERGKGETILVVEDEPDLLETLSAVLEDLGYRVTSASSGAQAWQMIESGTSFDILLSDVVMPGGIDGFELLRRTRARYPERPALLMSAHMGFTAGDVEGIDVPMLQKPCMPDELSKVLRQVLVRP